MTHPLNQVAAGLAQLFTDSELDEGRCPSCSSDNIGFDTQCQEDDHGEQIEHFAFCRDCDWSELG